MPHLGWLITCSHYPLASVLWWDKFELLSAVVRSSPPEAVKGPVHIILDEVQPLLVWNSVWTYKCARNTVGSKRACKWRWRALIGWSCLLVRWWHLISLSLHIVQVFMYLVIGDAEIALSDVNTAGGSNSGVWMEMLLHYRKLQISLWHHIWVIRSLSSVCVKVGRKNTTVVHWQNHHYPSNSLIEKRCGFCLSWL